MYKNNNITIPENALNSTNIPIKYNSQDEKIQQFLITENIEIPKPQKLNLSKEIILNNHNIFNSSKPEENKSSNVINIINSLNQLKDINLIPTQDKNYNQIHNENVNKIKPDSTNIKYGVGRFKTTSKDNKNNDKQNVSISNVEKQKLISDRIERLKKINENETNKSQSLGKTNVISKLFL